MRASKLVNLSSISLLSALRESLDGDGGGVAAGLGKTDFYQLKCIVEQ